MQWCLFNDMTSACNETVARYYAEFYGKNDDIWQTASCGDVILLLYTFGVYVTLPLSLYSTIWLYLEVFVSNVSTSFMYYIRYLYCNCSLTVAIV